jgi:competence protein ComEA
MKKLLLALCAWIAMVGIAFGAVNINTASKEELDKLKGIGPVKAQAIIDYRTKHGPFKTIDDLEKVPGIGPGTMKDIRADITVTGAKAPAKAADKGKKDTAEPKAAKKDEPKAAAKKADEPKAKKDEPKAAAKKADEPKAAPKKDDTKGAAKADEKAAPKKADEKAAKKDEGKATPTDTKAEKK